MRQQALVTEKLLNLATATFACASLACALFVCMPATAQTTPPEPDPLARIRAQPAGPVCSEAEPTLCAEAAPKIIASATGPTSELEQNLRHLVGQIRNRDRGTMAAEMTSDWAAAAFQSAGLRVQRQRFQSSDSHAVPEMAAQNVVAEIRGREKPDEIVILGARLDSWQSVTPKLEDDCNAAILVEAARAIVSTGLVPRRTIRFVLFAGLGAEPSDATAGSSAYVAAHPDEMDRTVATIIIAGDAGSITGYSLGGRHDIEPGVRLALAPLDSLRKLADSFDATFGGDNLDFLLEGVPDLVTNEKELDSVPDAGGVPDPLGRVDFQVLKQNAAIAGVTAFDVAEDVAPLGPRLSHAEIETLLKQTGLDEKLKAAGIWPQWEKGQLGRQP